MFLAIAVGGLFTSTIYLLLAAVAGWRFSRIGARHRQMPPSELPAAVMMKPLHGSEPRLRESLESFFLQNYPRYEILFGAREADDPALAIARELMLKYPQVRASIVLSGEPPWPNAKVYSLEKMFQQTTCDYLVISDSDVEVGPNYLRNIIGPLLDPKVGCVTCIYRGLPVGGPWALLEALGMSVEMTSGVLVADMLEGMKFALGPTMATRREVLEEIGGFEALGEFHSDDYVFGEWIAAAGYRVVLPHEVINHVVLNRALVPSLAHQLRWMKTTRFSRPKGHVGMGTTFAMPFGILGLFAAGALGNWKLGLALLAAAYLNRVVQSIAIGWGIARDLRALQFAWAYPLRDLIGFCLWAASYTGRHVQWRGERYRIHPGGKMMRVYGCEPAQK